MARSWFVTPKTVRIPLPEGEWIEVKKRLTAGESQRAKAAIVQEVRPDGRVTPNLEMIGKAEVLAYLVDWSLTREDGSRVIIDTPSAKQAAVDDMEEDDYKVIEKAVETHVKAMDAEREAEKNARATPSV